MIQNPQRNAQPKSVSQMPNNMYVERGAIMCREQYDITYDDLNPTFLFHCVSSRSEEEDNYHCHDFIELCVILKGESTFLIDGKCVSVREGDLLVFNPGVYHKGLGVNNNGVVTESYIAFTDIHFKDMRKDCLDFGGEEPLVHMNGITKQEVFKICNQIGKENHERHAGRYFMLKAYLIQLVLVLIRQFSEENIEESGGYIFESTNKKYVVKQIIKYMDQHYCEKLSLEHIAQNMYLSTFYIVKIFKSETGDTPINYLIHLRLNKAKEILESEKETSIQNVAASVGYEDVYHFSKLFKKHFGITPSKYKTSV